MLHVTGQHGWREKARERIKKNRILQKWLGDMAAQRKQVQIIKKNRILVEAQTEDLAAFR